ncbi:hypothetical protein KUCAC02_015604, partial [Chaenocephalus aceratus]
GLLLGEEKGRCFTIEYMMPTSIQMTSDSTISVLKMIRSSTPFPLVSLFFMFIGFVLSNIGHIRPHRTILAFISGIFFILSDMHNCMYDAAAGVMSVYLFMKRYTAEEMYRPHQGFYRPRLSNCSDYSGQFLHPDAWAGRGRSASSISSEASLQMNAASYPALLKCPEYEQVSSSPC